MRNVFILSILIISIFSIAVAQVENIDYKSLPAPCRQMVSASLNGNIIFAGGLNSSSFTQTSRALIYDSTLENPTIGSLSQPRDNIAVAAVGDIVMFAGGDLSNAYFSNVDIYNTISKKWSLEHLSVPRSNIAATALNGMVLFAGGDNGTYSPIDVIDIYNLSNRSWTTFTLPKQMTKMAATSIHELAIFANGQTKFSSATDVFVLNTTNWTWKQRQSANARFSAMALTVGEFAIIAGGFYGLEVVNYTEIYSYSNNSWTATNLKRARMESAAVAIGEYAVFGGGRNAATLPIGTVEIWNSLTNEWTEEWLNPNRTYMAGAVIDDKVIFAGGIEFPSLAKSARMEVWQFNVTLVPQPTTTAASPEPSTSSKGPSDMSALIIAVVVVGVVVIVGVPLIVFFIYRRKKSNNYNSEVPMQSRPQSTIPSTTIPNIRNVQVLRKLGGGNFGEVYEGNWKGASVALKKLKDSNYDEFIKESNMLFQLQHPNIVQFMGIFTNEQDEKFIVTEFMQFGDLLSLLRNDFYQKMTVQSMVSMAAQAASGMAYLESKKIVHRDLALRNLLVGGVSDQYVIKVSDFGLSRAVSDTNAYYQKDNSIMPIKWSAPESVNFGKFSSKSDVWSFGICLYELFSRGQNPYPTMSNTEAMDNIKKGYRMPKPDDCPDAIYQLMLRCWAEKTSDRPSFEEIVQKLTKGKFVVEESIYN